METTGSSEPSLMTRVPSSKAKAMTLELSVAMSRDQMRSRGE